jgi:hypothetical protein
MDTSLKIKSARAFYLLRPNDRKSDASSLYPVAKEQRDTIKPLISQGLYAADNRNRTCTVSHQNLNLARLPIPPYPRIAMALL